MLLVYYICSFVLRIYVSVAYFVVWCIYPFVKHLITKVFKSKGIGLKGVNSWDIKIHNEDKFFSRLGAEYSPAYGELYMDGIYDCEDITEMFFKLYRESPFVDINPFSKILHKLMLYSSNIQSRVRSLHVVEQHYNLGNDLFEIMLDKTMNYTCAYWRNAKTLEEAQRAKMDLIAKKLMLKKGMTVLDIGCGFGSLAKYLAEHYEIKVVGVNLSTEQTTWAKKSTAHLSNVEFRLCDYRDVNEKFDRIVSIGFFEAVGVRNFRSFFKLCEKCLTDDGISLLHTIGVSDPKMQAADLWIHKYIFPNGIIPRTEQIVEAMNGIFIIEDWQNFGHDYHLTLEMWRKNFNNGWPGLRFGSNGKYDEKFFRMWNFYLAIASAFFKSRKFNLWQIVLTKKGLLGGYYPPAALDE